MKTLASYLAATSCLLLLACGQSQSQHKDAETASGGATGPSAGSGGSLSDGGSAGAATDGQSGSGGAPDGGKADAAGSGNEVGTGAGGSVSDAPLDASSWSTACSAYAKAICGVINTCSVAALHHLFGTLQNCEARYGDTGCETQGNAPGSTLTPSALTACAQAWSTKTCEEYQFSVPAECAFHGTLADNAPCTYGHQCQAGACYMGDQSWCGTCKAKGKLGDSCSPLFRSCEDGLTCAEPSQSVWVCAKPLSEGTACYSHPECDLGLRCVDGHCARAKLLGEACTGNDCDYTQHDVICLGTADGGGSVCAQLSYSAAGESCNDNNGLGLVTCGNSAFCQTKNGGSGGSCVAALADGAPCNTSTGVCLYPALCINGKCTRAADVAGTCK